MNTNTLCGLALYGLSHIICARLFMSLEHFVFEFCICLWHTMWVQSYFYIFLFSPSACSWTFGTVACIRGGTREMEGSPWERSELTRIIVSTRIFVGGTSRVDQYHGDNRSCISWCVVFNQTRKVPTKVKDNWFLFSICSTEPKRSSPKWSSPPKTKHSATQMQISVTWKRE